MYTRGVTEGKTLEKSASIILNDSKRSGYVPVENGRIYYESDGKGEAVVLIHAGFVDSRMWDEQFNLLSRNYRAVRYDVRGFGKSSIATSNFSDAKDLHDLLSHLHIGKASLIGCSNGGRISFDFAVEYPTVLNSLILVAPGIRGYKNSGPEEERLWNEFEESMKPQEIADKEGRSKDAVEMDVNAWASAQAPEARKRIFEIAMDNFHVQKENPWKFQVSPEPPAFQRLSQIQAPTLFIIGDRDVPAQVLMTHHLHKQMPESKIVTLQGADHIANMSRPSEFNKTILDFLGTHA